MEAFVKEELEAIEKDISEVEDLYEEEILVKKVDERKPPTCTEIQKLKIGFRDIFISSK